jgi:hypothetical protein
MTIYSSRRLFEAYVDWGLGYIRQGWKPTLLTFMFNPLSGTPAVVGAKMDTEIDRIYGHVLTRVVNNPRSQSNCGRLPFWISAPDEPVRKRFKDHFANIAINDGMHRHALALTPPASKLRMTLADYIEGKLPLLTSEALHRIHTIEIEETPEKACRYIFKGLERSRITSEDIFIRPRSLSELTVRTKFERQEARAENLVSLGRGQ